MNDKRTGQRADYILTKNGSLTRNAEGDAVIVKYMEALEAHEQLQMSWAGAYVTGLLREHPWIESMTIKLKASGEYDDDGGTYRSISVSVGDVALRADVQPPADTIVDGQFDPDLGAALIEPSLDDACGDLYDAFHSEFDDNDDLVMTVERRSMVRLLERDQVNGTDAFVHLFPDHALSNLSPIANEVALGETQDRGSEGRHEPLRTVCRAIVAGYASGKSAMDMPDLLEAICDQADSILALIDRSSAVRAATATSFRVEASTSDPATRQSFEHHHIHDITVMHGKTAAIVQARAYLRRGYWVEIYNDNTKELLAGPFDPDQPEPAMCF